MKSMMGCWLTSWRSRSCRSPAQGHRVKAEGRGAQMGWRQICHASDMLQSVPGMCRECVFSYSTIEPPGKAKAEAEEAHHWLQARHSWVPPAQARVPLAPLLLPRRRLPAR